MGSPLNTVLLAAIAVLVLIPTLHLYGRLQTISLWTTRAYYSADRPTFTPSKGVLPPIQIKDQHELIYTIGNTTYFSPTHTPIAKLSIESRSSALFEYGTNPITVLPIPISATALSAHSLTIALQEALAIDDVISPRWLETLVLVPETASKSRDKVFCPQRPRLPLGALAALTHFGVNRLILHPSFDVPVPSEVRELGLVLGFLDSPTVAFGHLRGPFLASTDMVSGHLNLWPVYRLYSDIFRTFVFGIYPLDPWVTGGHKYKALRKVDEDGYNLIPVPSRLYTQHADSAVAGRRIGVKDIYNIKGVVTSGGSRAYRKVYGIANSTASSILRVEDLGGVLVGKTKTAMFAMGHVSNDDTLDEQYSWSPRADGYQSCGGSSSGSACAVAAYDWLDFAIGSDTGGSVRGPASISGLYGNRPSTGVLPLDGVIPLFDYSDTPGLLTRDPQTFSAVIRDWYRYSPLDFKTNSRAPSKLWIESKYLTQATPEAQRIVGQFVENVSKVSGISVVDIDLDSKLKQSNIDTGDIRKYGNFDLSASWWTWIQVGVNLTKAWRASHDGQYPPLDPDARGYWDFGRRNGSWDKYHEGIAVTSAARDWFNLEILPADKDSCSEGIFAYDIGFGGAPFYREKALNADSQSVDESLNRNTSMPGSIICPIAGCADYTIPIGQARFQSKISLVEEVKAVTVSLVVRHGCDLVLLDFVDQLRENGLLDTVKTGRTPF